MTTCHIGFTSNPVKLWRALGRSHLGILQIKENWPGWPGWRSPVQFVQFITSDTGFSDHEMVMLCKVHYGCLWLFGLL